MKNLDAQNPNIYSYFTAAEFSVQRWHKNRFGRIPVDQTIEETANKDTQTAGGTKRFSLKAGIISIYYVIASTEVPSYVTPGRY